MQINWIVVAAIIFWIYILTVFKRAKLDFWFFTIGSAGLFTVGIIVFEPVLLLPMQQAVAAVAGLFGELTNTFESYFSKGLIFISGQTQMTLYIDFECSGIIETFAYLALLAFFPAYRLYEKVVVGIIGTLAIFFANVLRIYVICQMVYFGGEKWYFWGHSFVGRLIFYALTIILYFYVFTKSQVVRQKVGAIKYESND